MKSTFSIYKKIVTQNECTTVFFPVQKERQVCFPVFFIITNKIKLIFFSNFLRHEQPTDKQHHWTFIPANRHQHHHSRYNNVKYYYDDERKEGPKGGKILRNQENARTVLHLQSSPRRRHPRRQTVRLEVLPKKSRQG